MQVEIWSDVACPWCYVGKRRFEAALARFEHRDAVDVRWRSFELDPHAPAERGMPLAEHLAAKYGIPIETARERQAALAATGAEEGLDLRFDVARSGSTFDAHRLIHLAETLDLQDAMKERLLRAYLSEGELVADHATLARLAAEVGLPTDEVERVLATDAFADEVRADERTAASLGIDAVPFFVVDRAIGAAGAHPADALLQLLEEGWGAAGAQ